MSDYIKHLITYKGCPPLTPPVTKITAAKHNLYYEPEDGTICCATCRWSTKHISDITMATLRCPAHPMHVLGCNSSFSPQQNRERVADAAYNSRSDKAEASLQRIVADNYNCRPETPDVSLYAHSNHTASNGMPSAQQNHARTIQHTNGFEKLEEPPTKPSGSNFHASYRTSETSALYNEGKHKVGNLGHGKTFPGSNTNGKLPTTVEKQGKRCDNVHKDTKLFESFNRDLVVADAIVEPADKYSKATSKNVYSVDQVQMKKLKNRLRTFEQEGWPESCPVPYRAIAEAGFYFMGRGDMVKCAFCGKRVHQWEQGDDPVMEHCKLSPYCEYAQNLRQ